MCFAQGGDKKAVPYTTLETGNLPGRSTYLPISAGSRPTRLNYFRFTPARARPGVLLRLPSAAGLDSDPLGS